MTKAECLKSGFSFFFENQIQQVKQWLYKTNFSDFSYTTIPVVMRYRVVLSLQTKLESRSHITFWYIFVTSFGICPLFAYGISDYRFTVILLSCNHHEISLMKCCFLFTFTLLGLMRK